MTAEYNLAVNLPLLDSIAPRLGEALRTEVLIADMLDYPDPAGPRWIRKAIGRWLERTSGHQSVDPDLMTLTIGARHAISLAMTATTGDRNPAILVEDRTYHGVRSLAHATGTQCVDVAMDEYGMRPDALAEAVKRSGASAVYIQPTLQNPTTITMPLARRVEIAAVAERLGLQIIEGDVYSPLHTSAHGGVTPLAEIVPGRTFYAGGIGKILGPGLRVGWLLNPNAEAQALAVKRIQLEQDGLPTAWPSVVARLMDDGTAEGLLHELAVAMTTRGELARRIVGPNLVTSCPSLHAWLPSPDAQALEKRLLARGVKVAASRHFVGIREKSSGIRLALGAEQDMRRLEEALRIVAQEY